MAKMNYYQAGDTPCVRDADGMQGQTYKHFCAEVLRKQGYKNVAVVSGAGKLMDRGVDIFAEKDGKSWAIQCRKYEEKEVKDTRVQDVEDARIKYNRDRAAILSNCPFSEGAKRAASGRHVRLWDREMLDQMIGQAYPEYDVEYYRAMKAKDKKGNLKTDGKIVIMYILLFAVMFFAMKYR